MSRSRGLVFKSVLRHGPCLSYLGAGYQHQAPGTAYLLPGYRARAPGCPVYPRSPARTLGARHLSSKSWLHFAFGLPPAPRKATPRSCLLLPPCPHQSPRTPSRFFFRPARRAPIQRSRVGPSAPAPFSTARPPRPRRSISLPLLRKP